MRKITVLSFAALFALTGAAFAASSGGGSSTSSGTSSGGGNSSGSASTLKCKSGEVVKKVSTNGVTKQKCVKATSGILPDEELYQQARLLAKQGQYDWALQVLAVIQNQEDPRVLTYIGYSNRKAGRVELGISYYTKALALNPNFVPAREYLGEGYLAAGKPELAQAQLAEIAARCGVACEEYKDLSSAIAGTH